MKINSPGSILSKILSTSACFVCLYIGLKSDAAAQDTAMQIWKEVSDISSLVVDDSAGGGGLTSPLNSNPPPSVTCSGGVTVNNCNGTITSSCAMDVLLNGGCPDITSRNYTVLSLKYQKMLKDSCLTRTPLESCYSASDTAETPNGLECLGSYSEGRLSLGCTTVGTPAARKSRWQGDITCTRSCQLVPVF